MKVEKTHLDGVLVISPVIYQDERGYFAETYRREVFAAAEIGAHFVQDNQSGSHAGVLRGLHYQIQQAQGKLVRCVHGEIFDVAVDLRADSPTCGHYFGMNLSASNQKQLWIPPGFAHGFYVLSEWADVVYKVTEYYAPEWERTLRWDDPQVGITWPLLEGKQPELSMKDAAGLSLQDAPLFDS